MVNVVQTAKVVLVAGNKTRRENEVKFVRLPECTVLRQQPARASSRAPRRCLGGGVPEPRDAGGRSPARRRAHAELGAQPARTAHRSGQRRHPLSLVRGHQGRRPTAFPAVGLLF